MTSWTHLSFTYNNYSAETPVIFIRIFMNGVLISE